MAAIAGLKAIKQNYPVVLYSDSKYVVDAMTQGWAVRWRANGWKRNKKAKAVNTDLWEQLLLICEQLDVEFRWVKGHSGDLENERCDTLAVQAAHQANLPVDLGYFPDPQ